MVIFIHGETNDTFIKIQPSVSLEKVKTVPGKWKEKTTEIKDFMGRSLRTALFNCSVFSLGTLNVDGSPSFYHGLDVKIIEEVTKLLNLNWKTIVPPENNKWGKLVNGSWDGGVLKMLADGTVDVAGCGLWFDISMYETGLEMSIPVGDECLLFLVPRPKPDITGWMVFFSPFQTSVWICGLLFYTLASFLLNIFCRISSLWYNQHKKFSSLGRCFFELYSIVLSAGNHKTMGAVRELMFSFVVMGFLLNTSFSSGLFSQLTMPRYTDKMDTIEELVENNYYWTNPIISDSTLMFDLDDPIEAAWSKKYILIETLDEVIEHYKKDPKMALVGQKVGVGMTLDDDFSNEFLRNFEAISDCLHSHSYIFGFRKGSPFVSPINTIIRRFQSSGLTNKILMDVFNLIRKEKPYVYELLELEKSHLNRHESLALWNVVGIFDFYIVGLTISICAFIIEILISKK